MASWCLFVCLFITAGHFGSRGSFVRSVVFSLPCGVAPAVTARTYAPRSAARPQVVPAADPFFIDSPPCSALTATATAFAAAPRRAGRTRAPTAGAPGHILGARARAFDLDPGELGRTSTVLAHFCSVRVLRGTQHFRPTLGAHPLTMPRSRAQTISCRPSPSFFFAVFAGCQE